MSFHNISDPAGVKALLDKLRSSQAWQESIAPESQANSNTTDALETPTPVPPTSGSVASLLSQLQDSTSHPSASYQPEHHASSEPQPAFTQSPAHPQHTYSYHEHDPNAYQPMSSSRPVQDLKTYTFQQALPVLGHMADDPAFVTRVKEMKRDQNALERRLWDERNAILKKYEDKVKVARTKANMIGVGLSRHEADMMTTAYQKELKKFDQERALPAWDGLISKQQTAFAALGTPTMFNTGIKADRERQQRVMQVVEGIVGNDAP
ncbi:hypothetical protein HGRIS_009840 [Hohenbuehelia grisea]|uniref:Clathrin light chain n=1 Tax=Hohenbuehelia grisea TaxID=104357 RepID=A0ABR3J2D2_9AGAR